VVLTLNATGAIRWEGISFPANADLETVRNLPHTILFDRAGTGSYSRIDATASGRVLAIAYDRVAGPETGEVPRAFFRFFADESRRRPIAH
jgi:hypothetical protein